MKDGQIQLTFVKDQLSAVLDAGDGKLAKAGPVAAGAGVQAFGKDGSVCV